MIDRRLWKKLGLIDPKSELVDPYLVLEERILEEKGTEFSGQSLSELEWRIVMTVFKNHPELVKIWAPMRDPEQERTPFSYSHTLKRIILGEDKDCKYVLNVQEKESHYK